MMQHVQWGRRVQRAAECCETRGVGASVVRAEPHHDYLVPGALTYDVRLLSV